MGYQLKAAVFDPFSTLIYFEHPIKTFNEFCEANGVEANYETKNLSYAALKENMSLRKFTTKLQGPHLAVATDYRTDLKAALASAKLHSGAIEVLADLKSMGLKIGLCANAAHPFKRVPRNLGLAPFIDAYFWSCDSHVIKPNEKPYLSICEKLGSRPRQTIYCSSDYNSDLFGAMKLGFETVWLSREDEKSHHHVTSLEGLVDYIAQALDEEQDETSTAPAGF